MRGPCIVRAKSATQFQKHRDQVRVIPMLLGSDFVVYGALCRGSSVSNTVCGMLVDSIIVFCAALSVQKKSSVFQVVP